MNNINDVNNFGKSAKTNRKIKNADSGDSNFMKALELSFKEDCEKSERMVQEEFETSQAFDERIEEIIEEEEKEEKKSNSLASAGSKAVCVLMAIGLLSASVLSIEPVRNMVTHFFEHEYSFLAIR